MLRYHYKEDPETMDDDTWVQRWRELSFVLDLEYKRQRNAFTEALTEVLNQIADSNE